MLTTSIITFLLKNAIPGLLLNIFIVLCPSLNAGIPITPFLIWKNARFQISAVIFFLTVVLLLSLYVYLSMPATLMIQLFLFLCQFGLFLSGQLAGYFQKKREENTNSNKLSA
ncbi:hypothetical protein CON27_28080 [Bacillus thuringiensis]|nr:hypothetical protein IG9_05662 [Bacillus cereus HuA2-9]KAA0782815.1 hypothetical protein DN393_24600 [Bacillus sp. BPN334]PEB65760.1 hypothetical protein COM91_29405 [Bacillus thuringiensis]PGA22259.1 hypothetical protein COL80_23545 [Bacillus thuringiensis]PGF18851.1 hypothetical protein CON27_28080 [Bacillus thuringiensis]